ncbi:unnamed protein product [Acanthoscelides obtectus]|uniref:Uncharacterized protein n=1 Tax=Acanthoscelides obtectus TaxID=200917 RepID=A0A9P0MME0_ACAOB|nr:unnamed protein product [Acanthoscelides obtectus]CAK1671584.1 hypothetical protein AOBTE_LOCUS28339 [Acanthoscelides obtectus]
MVGNTGDVYEAILQYLENIVKFSQENPRIDVISDVEIVPPHQSDDEKTQKKLKTVVFQFTMLSSINGIHTVNIRAQLDSAYWRNIQQHNDTVTKNREENVPHHTFSLPSERNIHAVIREIPASSPEQEIKEELELYIYTPLHVIDLKRNVPRAHAVGGGDPA